MTPSHAAVPSTEDLAAFRALQALAYRCAEEVAAGFQPGVTEREAVRRMAEWLLARGVNDYFHKPFAWFGARTALRWRNPLAFFPTDLPLGEGMPYILDVAPIRGGYVADIGYSASLGESSLQARIMDDLRAHRELIREGVTQRQSLRDIYHEVGRLAARQGYEVRHSAYPGRVIAHRVDKVREGPPRFFLGFGLKGLFALGRQFVQGLPTGSRPLWNGSRGSNHAATPGLWSVEPHLALGDVGAKFEELLLVTDAGASWLDDDLPHVRRWRVAERERHPLGA
jgi:Xaa-Pro aminopeptidase